MFVVNVDIRIKSGASSALEQTFREEFYPAISTQPGFVSAELLRPLKENSDYFLSLSFDRQSSQEKWVAIDLHQQVWSQMESHFEDYVVTKYNSVDR